MLRDNAAVYAPQPQQFNATVAVNGGDRSAAQRRFNLGSREQQQFNFRDNATVYALQPQQFNATVAVNGGDCDN